MLDDAYHYLSLRNLVGSHQTVEKPPESWDEHERYSSLQINSARTCQKNLCRKNSTPKLLVWSASDEGGLKRLARLYRKHIAELPEAISKDDCEYFEDLVYTLCTKRSSLSWKSFAIADSAMGLQQRLENSLSTPTRSSHVPRLAFVFTGQGAQWCGMGKELLTYTTFRESLQKAGKFFQSLGCRWDIFGKAKTLEQLRPALMISR